MYDLLVRTAELPAAIETARRHPDMRFVLDHAAKPPVRDGDATEWARRLAVAERTAERVVQALRPRHRGRLERVEQRGARSLPPPRARMVRPRAGDVRVGLAAMPPCGRYDEVLGLVLEALEEVDNDERDAVLGGNAMRVYRL